MKVLVVLLLVRLATGAPTSGEIEIREDFYENDKKIYTSEHEIIKIVVPPRVFYDHPPEDYHDVPMLFFVQGDYKEDGTFDSKGLFVLKIKTVEATKLLDNGIDITLAVNDSTKKVYFSTIDEIYVYNAENNTAEKYASVTKKVISIDKTKNGDGIYAFTANKELYKVTESGEKKVKFNDIKNAQQIVLDYEGNIYFYDDEKDVYVFTKNGSNKIDNLPENPKKIKMFKPMITGFINAIPIIVDDTAYLILDEKGRLLRLTGKIIAQPTAMYLDTDMGAYFGYKKSIYQTFI